MDFRPGGQVSATAVERGLSGFLPKFGGVSLSSPAAGVECCLNTLRYRGHLGGSPTGPPRLPVIREWPLFLVSTGGMLQSGCPPIRSAVRSPRAVSDGRSVSVATSSTERPSFPTWIVTHRAARDVNNARSGPIVGSRSMNEPTTHPALSTSSGVSATGDEPATRTPIGPPTPRCDTPWTTPTRHTAHRPGGPCGTGSPYSPLIPEEPVNGAR